jgi:hypothetical protein
VLELELVPVLGLDVTSQTVRMYNLHDAAELLGQGDMPKVEDEFEFEHESDDLLNSPSSRWD